MFPKNQKRRSVTRTRSHRFDILCVRSIIINGRYEKFIGTGYRDITSKEAPSRKKIIYREILQVAWHFSRYVLCLDFDRLVQDLVHPGKIWTRDRENSVIHRERATRSTRDTTLLCAALRIGYVFIAFMVRSRSQRPMGVNDFRIGIRSIAIRSIAAPQLPAIDCRGSIIVAVRLDRVQNGPSCVGVVNKSDDNRNSIIYLWRCENTKESVNTKSSLRHSWNDVR